MTAVAIILAVALALSLLAVFILALGNTDLAERLRKANARNEAQRREFGWRVRRLTWREDRLLDDLNFAVSLNADLLDRLFVLEARALPELDEIRMRGAR